jgi:CRP-like cAMP-binding protein/HEAT repeat protein
MQRLLRRLLNLQAGEGRKLGLLYLLGIVIATSLVWGGAIGRGLFLKRVGIEWLPLMFVFDGLLAFPITVVYTAIVDRVSNARLMAAIFGGAGVVLLAGWGLLLLDQWVVSIPYVIVVYALFYLAERVLRALFSIHAWTLFNDYLDIRAAKRLFPVLGSTSRVASIVGGSAVAVMPNFLSAQNMILAWVAVLVLGVWLSLSLPRWLAAYRQMPASVPTRKDGSSAATYWENLRGGFRFVSASSFLKALAIGALAMAVLVILLDYQAQRVFSEAYATAEGLISFYGMLETVINLIALPVQMFLVARLVSWLGVAQVNLFYPIGSLIIYVALSLWPSLGTAMAGQFGRDTFRSSVQVPVDNMLYNAVPLPVKGRARAFVKGLLLPLGTVAIGLALLPVQQVGALPVWVIGIGTAAALIQMVAAILVRRRYTEALVAMLADEDFSAYRLAGSDLGPPDPATFQRLLQRLQESDDDDSARFLARIAAEVGGREAGARLVETAEAATPHVRAGILETLLETETLDETALALSRQSLDARAPRARRVALAVLERLLGADNPDLWPLAAPLLDDPDLETRVLAILLLIRCGDFFYLADAIRSLNDLLADGTRPAFRAAGLRVLQAMGDGRMVRNLARYVDDPDDGVRLQAAQAIETLADPGAPDWAIHLTCEAVTCELADPVEAVRLSALRTLGKVESKDALERLTAALADRSDLVREQAAEGLMALGQKAVPAVTAVLDDELASEQTHREAAAVLGQMARDRIVGPGDAQRHIRRVESLLEEMLRRIYSDVRLISALGELEPGSRSSSKDSLPGLEALLPLPSRRKSTPSSTSDRAIPAQAMLRDGLHQRNDRRLEGAFHLLSATRCEPPSTIEVIARTLRDTPAKSPVRANALEALESLTSSRLARLVGQATGPDGIAVAELVITGQQEWGLEPLSPTQALESVLADPDRWLAALGIALVGQGELMELPTLQDTWLPTWFSDPDPVVRETARYTARQLELEIEMVETTEMATLESLSTVERAIFLKQVPFFASMTVDQLRTLADIAEEQYFGEGDTIFAEGDSGEALYVIVRGRVGLEREPKRGRVQRLETLSARQYFGERTIFDGAPHENRAVAVDQVHLLAVRREPLLTLIRRAPDLSLSLVTVLSQRLREADAKLAARTRPKPDQVMKLYDRLTGDE